MGGSLSRCYLAVIGAAPAPTSPDPRSSIEWALMDLAAYTTVDLAAYTAVERRLRVPVRAR